MSTHGKRSDHDGDGGPSPFPTPRPEGISRAPQDRQIARQASDGMMAPPAAPARRRESSLGRDDVSKSAHPRLPSRRKESSDPGVFQPPSTSSARTSTPESSSFPNSAAINSRVNSRTIDAGTKKATIRLESSSTVQLSSNYHSTKANASPRLAVGETPKGSPRSALQASAGLKEPTSPLRKGSVGLTEKPAAQRKGVKFVHPGKAVSPQRKALPIPKPSPSKPPSHPRFPENANDQNEEVKVDRRRELKRHTSNSSIIDDRHKLETRWNWTKQSVQDAFKKYLKILTENDDSLPDLDELDAYECEDDEEQHFIDEIRDQMLDDGQLPEREIAVFFLGFTLFQSKVKSLESQLKSARTMAFQRIAPNAKDSKRGLSRTISDFGKGPLRGAMHADVRRSSSLLATKGISNEDRGLSCKFMSIKRIQHDPKTSSEHQRLLKELEEAEKKRKKLEKQIKQAGLQIAEDIPYEEANKEVANIAARMQEIGSSEVTHPDKQKQAELRAEYYELEQKMEKFSTALMLTDEYIEEQEEKEMAWEKRNEEPNNEALKKLRRHMPVAVKSMSEAQLCSHPTPNGKMLPKAFAKKFKRTNVLQLLRTNPDDIYRMHAATLENLRVAGMTLTERRAMYAHIKDIGPRWKAMQAETMAERKWTWFNMMRTNLKETLAQYESHVEKYGPPGNHPYATRANPKEGCPMIGKQCPLRADRQPSYDDDFGFPEEAEYEVTVVRKPDVAGRDTKAVSNALALARERRANQRLNSLKKHYKGILQVSQANGSCEAMDEAMEKMELLQMKWIENAITQGVKPVAEDAKRKEMRGLRDALNDLRLSVSHFAERSGMQLTGKRDTNADMIDIRSSLEVGLCEDVCELANDFFAGIQQRMTELSVKDRRIKVFTEQLRELLDELHDRNIKTLQRLGVKRPAPSRKRRSREAMVKEAKAKIKVAVVEKAEKGDSHSPVSALAGNRDLKSGITGIRRGDAGDGGGKSNLMAAILANGSKKGARERGSSGGDLLSALAATGPGKIGQKAGGGRGNFLAEIQAKAAAREAAGGGG